MSKPELKAVFSILAECTRDELIVVQSYIASQIEARSKMTFSTSPFAPLRWASLPEQVMKPPIDPVLPAKIELRQDENGDTYTYACTQGSAHDCKFYTDEVHPLCDIDCKCLYVTGLSPRMDYVAHRADWIDVIGTYKSKKIYVNDHGLYGFIIFEKHSDAVDAQKSLLESNSLRDERLIVSFADKNNKHYLRGQDE